MKLSILILVAIILTLTSCEGFIHLQGHIVDSLTNQPIENVRVLLVLKGKDTLINDKLRYDTIPYKDRLALRKKGIKDNYQEYDTNGFSMLVPSETDTTGYFSVGYILVGCVPKCPTCQLMFIKDGYEPIAAKLNSIVKDNMIIRLPRMCKNSAEK